MSSQCHRPGFHRCPNSWQLVNLLSSQHCITTCSVLTHLTGMIAVYPKARHLQHCPEYPVTAAIPYLVLCPGCSAANQDMLTAVLSSEVPATPLGSFPAIFHQALALGTLSRRRVYHEALQQQQRQKKKNRRWQAGLQKKKLALDVPCRSAANTAEVSDFHWHLASNDRVRCDQPNTFWMYC